MSTRFKGWHLFNSCPVNSWFECDTQTLSEMEVPHRHDNSGKFEILYSGEIPGLQSRWSQITLTKILYSGGSLWYDSGQNLKMTQTS